LTFGTGTFTDVSENEQKHHASGPPILKEDLTILKSEEKTCLLCSGLNFVQIFDFN